MPRRRSKPSKRKIGQTQTKRRRGSFVPKGFLATQLTKRQKKKLLAIVEGKTKQARQTREEYSAQVYGLHLSDAEERAQAGLIRGRTTISKIEENKLSERLTTVQYKVDPATNEETPILWYDKKTHRYVGKRKVQKLAAQYRYRERHRFYRKAYGMTEKQIRKTDREVLRGLEYYAGTDTDRISLGV